jgi:hypothetical protein
MWRGNNRAFNLKHSNKTISLNKTRNNYIKLGIIIVTIIIFSRELENFGISMQRMMTDVRAIQKKNAQ